MRELGEVAVKQEAWEAWGPVARAELVEVEVDDPSTSWVARLSTYHPSCLSWRVQALAEGLVEQPPV